MRSLWFLALACFTSSLWPISAQAGVVRVALLEHAQVRSDSVFLSDLLPTDIPNTLREAATKISFGAAPQNGTSRQISRASIVATLAENGLSPASFVVPEVLTVERSGHQVTREEVYSAIRQALDRNRFAELPSFQLEDLSLDATVFVPDDHPDLEVTQAAFDEFIGRARFRLWTRSAPEVHPFFATARISTQFGSLSPASTPARSAVVSASSESSIAQPYLIESNRFARLQLHSLNANILLQVKALQRGRLGDVIRVRLPGNGKTLLARVIGSQSLNASF